MAVFATIEEYYNVMRRLFERMRDENGAEGVIHQARLVLRLRTTDPQAVITVNGRRKPMEITYGENHVQADLDITLPADLLHDIWLNRVSLRESFFAGEIKVKGPIVRAMQVAPLFEAAERLYPQVLAEQGYPVETGSI